MFWFQTIDATDGKQARKTDNCSPLGQLLDHSKWRLKDIKTIDLD
jgi:phosphatidylglycerophosphate synthase